MAAKLKFPDPSAYSLDKPVVFCPKDRVVGLYTQETGKSATSLSKRVAEWFSEESKKHGWAGCILVPVVQTKHHAGCILANKKSLNITLNTILVNAGTVQA